MRLALRSAPVVAMKAVLSACLVAATLVACGGSSDPAEYAEGLSVSAPPGPQERQTKKVRTAYSAEEGEVRAFLYALNECRARGATDWTDCGRVPMTGLKVVLEIPGVAGDRLGVTDAEGNVRWELELTPEQVATMTVSSYENGALCVPAQSASDFFEVCELEEVIFNADRTRDRDTKMSAVYDIVERTYVDPCAKRGLRTVGVAIEPLGCTNEGRNGENDWSCSMKRASTCADQGGLPSQHKNVEFAYEYDGDVDRLRASLEAKAGSCKQLAKYLYRDERSGFNSLGAIAWVCP